ncbi:MAG: hypothetical protein GEU88_05175 [Solirubrobacterales bacterium]|nr:hypothetical protein [Solirubrobacterales bacterium]
MGEEIAISAHPPLQPRGPWPRIVALVLAAALAPALAACGGGADERQDADEPEGKFPVDVVTAKFPTDQRLAETRDLRLEIENAGDEPVPTLVVTIYTGDEKASQPFSVRSDQPGLADPNRPVWILDEGFPKLVAPGGSGKGLSQAPTAGADVAQTDTFAFGSLAAGERKDIVWRVTAVVPGTYTVHYELAGGLTGKARAVTADGSPAEGEFVVTISDKPPRARVTGTGKVELEGG